MHKITDIINTFVLDVGIHWHQALNIYESFFSNYTETVTLLEICIKHKDYITIQNHAHQLKGTTANLRMAYISDIACLVESAAKSNDIKLCSSYIQKLSENIFSLQSQMSSFKNIRELNILIVEDNLASGKVLEQIIINLGHHSLGIISSPEQVLLSVKNERPDLIFMDIDLSSEMNGINTAELLSGYHAIPVIFISIHADESIIKNAKEYGLGYIVKPFTPKEIEDMINLACINMESPSNTHETTPIKLKIKDDNRIFFIDLIDVIYFEAQAHTILAYTDQGTYKLNSSLKSIMALDKNHSFIQPHRSFLVNRAQIKELVNNNYSYEIKLKFLSHTIPVSKKNVKIIKTITF